MADSDNEGPGGSPPGPLRDTFPEFVRYARNRQKKGPRKAPPPAPVRVRRPTVRQAGIASAAVVFLFLAWSGFRALTVPKKPPPGERARVKVGTWIDLPRPAKMGEVPESWAGLRLSMRLADIDPARRSPYTEPDRWADVVYHPDPAKEDVWIGLSFYKDRLYRMSVRLGEESPVETGHYLTSATLAYGRARGYEYPTFTAQHIVTVFQSETRVLKLDSVKRDDDMYVSEVMLSDQEAAAARETARARGLKN